MSKWTTAVSALEAVITAAFSGDSAVSVKRNEIAPVRLDRDGALVLLHDGSVIDSEMTMSPLRWHMTQAASVEIFVRHATGGQRAARMGAVLAAIDAAVLADVTLGGAVEYAQVQPAEEPDDLAIEGADYIMARMVAVHLQFTAATPNG